MPNTSPRMMIERVGVGVLLVSVLCATAASAQGPVMYYNPFVRQRHDSQQNDSCDATPSASVVAEAVTEQDRVQGKFDTATAELQTLFTTLVGTAKAHTITKDEFANGIINVALMQIELNKKIEAYNRQHPTQTVVIDARHTWYENVDHIVSEVIPRR